MNQSRQAAELLPAGKARQGKQRAGRVYGAVGVCRHSLSIDFFFLRVNVSYFKNQLQSNLNRLSN